MSADPPWDIEGVQPEAREAAKLAARRLGISIGQWITQTILATAAQDLKHGSRRGATIAEGSTPATDDPYGPDLVTRSQEIYARRARGNDSGANGGSGPPALTPEAILEGIRKLAIRLDEAETRTGEAIAPLAARIESLDRRVGEFRDRSPTTAAPVERAMMRLAERLEKLEGKRREKRGLAGRLFYRG
jgi:localization factor PodJL